MTWAIGAVLAAVLFGAVFLRWLDDSMGRIDRAWPVLAIATAAIATTLDGAATGNPGWDATLRAGLVLGLALAGGVAAPGWTGAAALIGLATCAAASSAPQPSSVLLGAAAGLALVMLLTHPTPWLGSLAGGLTGLGLLGLTWPEWNGGPSAAAALATLVALAGGRLGAEGRARSIARAVSWALPVAAVVLVAAAYLSLNGLRSDAQTAANEVRRGLNASDDGDRVTALASFESASRALQSTAEQLDRPLVRLFGAVPVLAQNLDAAETVATLGTTLTGHARSALIASDPTEVRGPDGDIRIDAIETITAELTAVDGSITSALEELAAVESPWLLGPLDERIDELSERLADSQPKLDRARRLTGILPDLLGGNGVRRYFLAVMTPSELRGTIGIIGNYGEVVALDGRLTLPVRGRDSDLNRGTDWRERTLIAPEDYIARYERLDPRRYWQEIPSSPDFPTVAEVVNNMYPQSGGRPVDGVIGIDPVALGSLLKLTGPVTVEGWPDPLTAANVERVLLFEQYVRYVDDNATRADFLNRATEVIFDRFVRLNNEPAELARVLGELVRERHLMFESFDESEAAVLTELGGTGAFPDPADGDVLGVVTHNRGGNKIDWFLRRTVTSRVTVGADGAVRNSLSVQLANDAPASGLPAYIIGGVSYAPEAFGTNLQFLSVYSPHQLVSASIDGRPLEMVPERELGMNVYTALVSIPPGGTVTVDVELAGTSSVPYSLQLFRQTLVTPDQVRIELVTPTGWQVTSGPHTPSATTLEGAVALEQEQRVAWVVHAGPG